MRSSELYAKRAEDVNAFLTAYQDLIAWMEPVQKAGTITLREFRPLVSKKQQAQELFHVVARKAGRAGTLAGRVAAFVGFPAQVRTIVADQHPGLAKAAFTIGVIGQVLVTAIGGALATGIVAGLLKLAKLL